LERGRKALPAKWRGMVGRMLWHGMVGNPRQDAVRTFRPRSREFYLVVKNEAFTFVLTINHYLPN